MSSASAHVVHSRDDALALFKKGSLSRHTRGTKLNPQSSRSHAIFTIHCSLMTGNLQSNSCLHLVDLAGTESVRSTGHEGIALKEGININQCLLGLHLLLRNLARNEISVSYRESVLTTLLQDAINANNYVVLLGCISPSVQHVKGTLTTLEFVSESKCVRSKPLIQAKYEAFKKDCEEKEGDNHGAKKQFLVPEIPQRRLMKTPGSAKICKFPKSYLGSGINKVGTTPSRSVRAFGKVGFGNSTPRTPGGNLTYATPQRPHMRIIKMNATADTDCFGKRALPVFDKSNEEILFNGDFTRFSTSTVIEKSNDSPLIKKFEERISSLVKRLEHLEKSNIENQISTQNTFNNPEIINNTDKTMNEDVISVTNNETIDVEDSSISNEKQVTRRVSLRKQVLTSDTRNNASISPGQFLASPKFKAPDFTTADLCAKDSISKLRRSIRFGNKLETLLEDSRVTKRKTPLTRDLENNTCTTPPNKPSVRRSIRISNYIKSIDTPMQSNYSLPSSKRDYVDSTVRKSTVKRKYMKKNDKSFSKNFFFQLKMGENGQPLVVNATNMNDSFNTFIEDSKLKSDRRKSQITKSSEKENRIYSSRTSCHATIQKLVLHIINTGSIKDLQVLETIGRVTAEHLYNYRESHGKFKSLQQLRKLPFWKEKAYLRFLTANNM